VLTCRGRSQQRLAIGKRATSDSWSTLRSGPALNLAAYGD
jgi:hypothetical protein